MLKASPAGSGRPGRGGVRAVRGSGRLGGGVAARKAAREMPADGFPWRSVLVPGVPRCPPRVPAASPGQSRRSGSPALHNVPAGSGAAAADAVRGGGLGPGQRQPCLGHKTTGSCCRSPPARPSSLSGVVGACCPRAIGINGSGPGPELRLSQPALSVTFCRCFLGAAGPIA